MNPNAIPDYSAFASSLNPDQRSYVQNYVLSSISELVSPLIAESIKLTQQNKALQETISTLQAQVAKYDSRFTDDAKYILTRAKIVSLMKDLGI